MKIFLAISIDTECDKNAHWEIPRPMSFLNILEDLPGTLHPCILRHGFQASYLLSPEVVREARCVAALNDLDGRTELGTHLHGEFIEPNPEWNAVGTFDYQADYTEEMESDKVANLTKSFEQAFGFRPTSFRAGRFGMGANTLKILSSQGYLVDSSMFPLRLMSTRFHSSDRTEVDSDPEFYFQVDGGADGPGSRPLLEFPLTVHSRLRQRIPRNLRRSYRRLPLRQLARVFGREGVLPISLRPNLNAPGSMQRLMDSFIASRKDQAVVFLNMMFHSNEVRPGSSPSCSSPEEARQYMQELENALIHARDLGAQPITLSDAWFLLQEQIPPTDPRTYFSTVHATIHANVH